MPLVDPFISHASAEVTASTSGEPTGTSHTSLERTHCIFLHGCTDRAVTGLLLILQRPFTSSGTLV